MNRALGRRALFEDRVEFRCFLALWATAVRRAWLEVHAFALLGTHFHLLVRTREKGLSEAMAWIQSRYALAFNRRHDRDGPLMRARFTSKRADDEEYRRLLVGYIDWNPIAAGLAGSPADYEFCSGYHHLRQRPPPWLETAWVRDFVGTPLTPERYQACFPASARQAEVIEFSCWHRNAGPDASLTTAAREGDIGSWLRTRARIADGDPRRCHALLAPQCLIRAMTSGQRQTSIPVAGPRLPERAMLVGLLRSLCALSYRQIAQLLGISPQGCHDAWGRHVRALETDTGYRRRCAEVTAAALLDVYRVDENTG